MEEHESLTAMERSDEDCVLRFADGASFKIDYLTIRKNCQCAKCKPKQANEQRKLEFEEEIERFRLEKPRVELVGRYAIRMEWPSGCSSGLHAFSHLRRISEDSGTRL